MHTTEYYNKIISNTIINIKIDSLINAALDIISCELQDAANKDVYLFHSTTLDKAIYFSDRDTISIILCGINYIISKKDIIKKYCILSCNSNSARNDLQIMQEAILELLSLLSKLYN